MKKSQATATASIPLSALRSQQQQQETTKDRSILPRKDSRLPDDHRPIFLKTGLISRASGSAYFECPNVKIMASVHGPREPPRGKSFHGKLIVEFKYAPFSNSSKRYQQQRSIDERDIGRQIEIALLPAVIMGKYPKSVIDVFVVVLESDGSGSSLAAAINCASLALIDAGIEMTDIVAASSVTLVEDTILVDATQEEEERRNGTLVISLMPSIDHVSHVMHQGAVDSKKAISAFEKCLDNIGMIYASMTDCLTKSVIQNNI